MFRSIYIQKIAAAFLLMVFALSITPTIVFHNWFAGHADTVRKIGNDETEQVGRQTFNCHCDNIVAESPFAQTATTFTLPAQQSYSLFKAEKRSILFSTPARLHALRGPPVV